MTALLVPQNDLRVVEQLWFDRQPVVPPSSPKQLDVLVIPTKLACDLNAMWHSRFPYIHWSNVVRNKRSVCFAATYGGLYWASAIWSSPIAANRLKNGDKMLELRRMAIASEAPRNTASRMLKLMRHWIVNNFDEITTLISYQDTDVHHGTIYKASNWIAVSQTKDGLAWDQTRKRNTAQSTAPKVRWELQIR